MNAKFLKNKKYVIVALFLLATLLSLWLAGKVAINYNISDYLDESTETKISLEIIGKEFGSASDIQVMIEDIDVDTAKGVVETIKALPNVLTVNFNEADTNYYKDGDALFVILVNGDEYSDVANSVVADIKAALDESFEGKTIYGGSVVGKSTMREAIQKEVVLILAISLCLVVAIMLIMAKSWIEPIVLLMASGVAVFVNKGTNAMFGEISYITNAVAAILQLALSVDYSIVLLHGYRKAKETEPSSEQAMRTAVKNVLKPVSASALTTIAGLLALLFMTMTIGFDIGIVLMKGIAISAVCSLVLLPQLLLIFEKLMDKTAKRDLVLKGKKISELAVKSCKVVVPLALVLVIVCGSLQFGNSYTFTDSASAGAAIRAKFGSNSNIIVLYPNADDNHEKESSLAGKLAAFRTTDGKTALKSYTAYSNTVRDLYDVDTAVNKLGISRSDVEMLVTMYHIYTDGSTVELTPADFVKYAEELAENDPDVKDFTDEETVKTLRTLLVIEEIMSGEHTAEELHTLATTGVMEGTNLSLFAIKQMYGLYSYNKITNQKIGIKNLITYMANAAKSGALGSLVDSETTESIVALSDGLKSFETEMNKKMTKSQFKQYMMTEQGIVLTTEQVDLIYSAYFADKSGVVYEKINLMALLNYLVEAGQLTDAEAIAGIEQLNELYDLDVEEFRALMDKEMTRTEFGSYLASELGVQLGATELSIIYMEYSNANGGTPLHKIRFLSLLNYLADAGYVTDADSVAQIKSLNDIYDRNLESMQADLKKNMTTAEFRKYLSNEFGVELDASTVGLIFAAYSADKNGLGGNTIELIPLMSYLVKAGQVTDPDAVATINLGSKLLAALSTTFAYDEVLPLLSDIVGSMGEGSVDLGVDDLAIQQVYIMYFYDKGMIPSDEVLGRDFFDLVIESVKTNAIVRSQLSEETLVKLQDLYAVNNFMSDKETYGFSDMTAKITALKNDIQSIAATSELGEDAVAGLYIKYAIGAELDVCQPIAAYDILCFIVENMNTNELLKSRISEENRAKIDEAQATMNSATALFFGENYSRMILSMDLPSESAESTRFVEYLNSAVKEVFGDEAHVAGEMVVTYDLQRTFSTDNLIITIFTIVSIFLIVLIIFRSISLPVILVTIIQGAIWICMSTSLITGPMFFMSYIITNCILMGATIDYGILMSTSYVEYRQTLGKKEALERALEIALPTVFTSGLILTICGFVVGLISSQNSIATVGVLLGKGTLVSIAMVTLVLPAVLYLLDKFILKMTMNAKSATDK